MNQHNATIHHKIEQFLSQYYKSRLLKGTLIIVGAILMYLLIMILGEYMLYMRSSIKLVVLSLFGIVALWAIVKYIIIPTFQVFRIGRDLTHKDAAKIIGQHFPDIKDKLLNILELNDNARVNGAHSLIVASIDQKTKQLSPFNFTKAIDLGRNKKYIPWALVPLIIGLLIYLLNPHILEDGSYRLLQANKDFQRPAPFTFHLNNKHLEVPYNESIKVSVTLRGREIPEGMYIVFGNEKILMSPQGNHTHSYEIANVTKETQFYLEAAGYSSSPYKIVIHAKPRILNTAMNIQYPSFAQRQNERINGITDVTIPAQSTLLYEIDAEHTSTVWMNTADGRQHSFSRVGDKFRLFYTPNSDITYSIYIGNAQFPMADSMSYSITMIQDQPPTISVKEVREKISGEQTLLIGSAADDYGLTRAQFVYQLSGDTKQRQFSRTINLPLTGRTNTTLQQYFDFGTLSMMPGERVSYFIQVTDNGGHTVRSQTYEYKLPKGEAAKEKIQEQSEEINNAIAQSKEASKEMEDRLNKMKEDALKSNQMNSWEQKQSMEQLLEQQQKFKESLEQIQKRMEAQKKLQDPNQQNESIKEQQEAIEKKIEDMKEKQLSEQMKKLQDLMNKKNENQPTNDMQELQKLMEENKLFNMDMDQLQAMIDNLEAQLMMEELADKLEQLADKQQALEQKTGNNTQQNEQLKKEQDALKKELDKMVKEDMKAIDEKSKKADLKDEQDEGKEASDDMQQSSDDLDNNKNESSKKNQKQAENKLRQMSSKIKSKAKGMDAEQIEIDIKATRQLLTNLLRLSFDQEDLIEEIRKTQPTSKRYTELIQDQYKLRVSASLIRDSLIALSHRAMLIGPTINRETVDLEHRLKDATSLMEERIPNRATTTQRYVMTHSNNLALLLNELLANLMQMQSMASGSGKSGGKPTPGAQGKGSGKQGEGSGGDMMKDIISGQQKMGKGLSQLKKEGGKQPGGQSPGGQQGESGSGSGNGGSGSDGNNAELSEQLSRMAFEQAKLRNQMQQLNSMLNSKGIKGNAALMKEIMDKMDKLESDLINRRLNQKQLEQQQSEILTRMLKAEEAIREQEQDTKRQGEQGIDKPRPIPAELQRYINEQRQIKDLYRTAPPTLRPYYKKIADEYMQRIAL